eukprot:Rhum_TRINITY_DN4375_c0_g1::Rhum_TRINITY_DN4375_c0_g1_i1::g.14088::m.14088
MSALLRVEPVAAAAAEALVRRIPVRDLPRVPRLPARVRNVLQIFGHLVVRLLQHLHQRRRVGLVLPDHVKGVRRPPLAGPPRAPNAVDVVLDVRRHAVVHHKLQIRHVDATRRHRRGHQDVLAAHLELVQGKVPVQLVHPAVQRHAVLIVPRLEQRLPQLVDLLLRLREDEDEPLRVPRAQYLQQPLELVVRVLEALDELRHVRRRAAPPAHQHLHRLRRQETLRRRLNLLLERGREHDHLAVRTHVVRDLRHLRAEAVVEHAVRLVQHAEGRPVRAQHTPLVRHHEVDQPPRRADHDVHTPLQLLDLVADRRPAVARAAPQLHLLAEQRRGPVHLHGQLTRRHEHPPDGTLAVGERRLVEDVPDHRQHVRHGLARPCARDADHVKPRHDHRDALRLDGERHLEPLLTQRVDQAVGEAALFPLLDGRRDLVRVRPVHNAHAHLVERVPPLRHRLRRKPLHRTRGHVEVLAERRVVDGRVVHLLEVLDVLLLLLHVVRTLLEVLVVEVEVHLLLARLRSLRVPIVLRRRRRRRRTRALLATHIHIRHSGRGLLR